MIQLRCQECSSVFAAARDALRCPACDAGLVLVEGSGGVAIPTPNPSSIWDFAGVLPQIPENRRVSLGEGGTPLLEIDTPKRGRRWVKWEGIGPTQSYKDRFNAVNMSVAKHLGATGVALVSTGNAGLAAAAYGAAAGLAVLVICTPETPELIRTEIPRLGAELRVVDRAHTRTELRRACAEGWFPGSRSVPADDVTPFGCEGYKTIAYEIVGALGDAPTTVVVPVGGGDGIYGIGCGFAELLAAGQTSRLPRMIGARALSPRASSIVDDYVGVHAMDAVAASGGRMVDVTESEMDAAVSHLATSGISAEPASACAWAIASEIADESDGQVVGVVTGHGFKWKDRA